MLTGSQCTSDIKEQWFYGVIMALGISNYTLIIAVALFARVDNVPNNVLKPKPSLENMEVLYRWGSFDNYSNINMLNLITMKLPWLDVLSTENVWLINVM